MPRKIFTKAGTGGAIARSGGQRSFSAIGTRSAWISDPIGARSVIMRSKSKSSEASTTCVATSTRPALPTPSRPNRSCTVASCFSRSATVNRACHVIIFSTSSQLFKAPNSYSVLCRFWDVFCSMFLSPLRSSISSDSRRHALSERTDSQEWRP